MSKPPLLDVALAAYDAQQTSVVSVQASPTQVFAALAKFNPQHDMALRTAFMLHDAPALLCAAAGVQARSLSRLGPLQQSAMAFRPPSDNDLGELLLGFVGKFWWPVSPIAMPSLDQFCAWDRPASTKVVWGFSVQPAENKSSTLTCELRTKSASRKARLAFGTYWRLVAPVSDALRARLLSEVKLAAQAS